VIPTAEFLGMISYQTGWAAKAHALTQLGGSATGNINTTGILAACAFVFIHLNGIWQVYIDLRRGTYGHHEAHEEHSSNGSPGREASLDLDHMRGESLAADVPQEFKAIGNPTQHYIDDQHIPHAAHNALAQATHGSASFAKAALLAVPLYLWNFAPHPFRPEKGAGIAGWFLDVPFWSLLVVLELIGAIIKPIVLAIRLFANMIAGHLVLAILIGLIVMVPSYLAQTAIFVPMAALSLLIWILEVFVAFLQAYIFTFLTTLFVASAIAPEH
jgi:F0F1-type ATP synthase membrane subunit a